IFWMRGLLRDFADRGGTVLLSSHLLREIEAIADHLVVIGNGRIAADGAKDDLLAGTGVLVRGIAAGLLAGAPGRAGLKAAPHADGSFVVDAEPVAVGRAAAAAGVVLTELRRADGSGPEELFLSLTREAPADRGHTRAGAP